MLTCYAAIAPAFANALFYSSFIAVVRESCELFDYSDTLTLLDAVCGDVWRECNRRRDMQAWELFKLHANRYCHATGELARDRVLTFMWAGSVY